MTKTDKILSVIAVLCMLPALIAYWQYIAIALVIVAVIAAFCWLNHITNGAFGWFLMLGLIGHDS
jgi:hypothetical protein